MSDAFDFVLPDWSSDAPYLYTERFSGAQWSWEYLRRNAEFRADWAAAQTEYRLVGREGATTMLMSEHPVPSLDRWGCLYATAPDQNAVEAFVFWNPERYPGALRLNAFPVSAKVDATPFKVGDIVMPSVLLEMPSGPQHLLFVEGGRNLQLVVEGRDILKPVRLMTSGTPDQSHAAAQLRALRCFNDLRLTGRLYDSHVQRDPLSRRLRLILRILDASLSGASQQDIARTVFAADYTDAFWDAPGQSLRDRVRRALSRGRALMREGYRDLLS